MRSLTLAVTALAAALAAPSVLALGPATVATGTGVHTLTAEDGAVCEDSGQFTFTLDAVTGFGTFSGTSPCVFGPDLWFDQCAVDDAGTLACGYATDEGAVSSFVLLADGSFSYSYLYATGASETVVGFLTSV